MGDFCIDVSPPEDEWAKSLVPPEESFIWPTPATEITVWNFLRGRRVRKVGPQGCGKTDLDRMVAAKLGVPYLQLSFNVALEPDDLVGRVNLRDGETHFIESDFVKFLRLEGHRMVQINELARAPAHAVMILQTLIPRVNSHIILQGKE